MVQGLIESELSVTGRENRNEVVEVGRGKDVIGLQFVVDFNVFSLQSPDVTHLVLMAI